MLTLLIVDDEYKICSLIRRLIEWERLQIKEIGTASNGKDALEIIKEKTPDIILTDVRMPIMNGLDLIAQSANLGWTGKFIVMSGYTQFEYAYTAIKYGVEDFLLKPLNHDELNFTLECIVERLQGKEHIETDSARSLYISSMINNVYAKEDLSISQCNKKYHTKFNEGKFIAGMVNIDYAKTGGAFFSNIESSVKKMVQDQLQEYCYDCIVESSGAKIYFLLNYNLNNEKAMTNAQRQLFKDVSSTVSVYSFAKVTLAIGSAEESLAGMSRSIKAAKAMIDSRVVLGVDRCLNFDSYNFPIDHLEKIPAPSLSKELLKALDILQFNQAMVIILKGWNDVLPLFKKYPYDNISWTCSYVISILTAISSRIINVQNLEDYYDSIPKAISNCIELSEMHDCLKESFEHVFKNIEGQMQNEHQQIVAITYQYILNHLEEQVTLEDVAKQVHLSPSYLGTLLKKKTGVTFTYFATNIRMEQAKKLLQDMSYSIQEVSAMTGYKEPRYFRKVFKKNVGVRPSEYRKIASHYAP